MIYALLVLYFAANMTVLFSLQRAFRRERAEWASERRELLNRIQHPEIVPQAVTEFASVPQAVLDEMNRAKAEWNRVGTIEIDPTEFLG